MHKQADNFLQGERRRKSSGNSESLLFLSDFPACFEQFKAKWIPRYVCYSADKLYVTLKQKANLWQWICRTRFKSMFLHRQKDVKCLVVPGIQSPERSIKLGIWHPYPCLYERAGIGLYWSPPPICNRGWGDVGMQLAPFPLCCLESFRNCLSIAREIRKMEIMWRPNNGALPAPLISL